MENKVRLVCLECGGELEQESGSLGIDSVWVCENYGFFRKHYRKIPKNIYDKYLKQQTDSLGYSYKKSSPQ